MAKRYFATKSRSQGREGWCALFRHPVRKDANGRPVRVRKGLGTQDESEADQSIEKLNRLLGDETYWPLSARERAEREFGARVAAIFYGDMEATETDPWAQREEVIPLPGADEGYVRVLVIGPTGAGKTTLLRQLIGSDRFPSTSTARTTIFDIEVVITENLPYRAVVAFLPRDLVRFYLEECLVSAVSAAAEGSADRVILRNLLEHREHRFRLSYLLGTLPEEEDGDLEDDDAETLDGEGESELTAETLEHQQAFMRDLLARIQHLARTVGGDVARQLELDPEALSRADRDAFVEMIEHELHENDEAQSVIDDIEDEIEQRFRLIEEGKCEADRSGWVRRWTLECDDPDIFVKTVNRFSSNYHGNFGRLLTPLVQGLRVSGPFRAAWDEDGAARKLVFMDGEGLGHTPDSVASLPAAVTRRYEIADAIVLVDNAMQPMLGGTQAVLRSVAASGNDGKLMITFTHFDQVRGANLKDSGAKREHVLAQLEGAVRGLESVLGSYAVRSLRRSLDDQVFFVGGIHEALSERARLTRSELARLVARLELAIAPTEAPSATPVYDFGNLVVCVERAAENFHNEWNARVGLGSHAGVVPAHWTQVKALSRRVAFQFENGEYGSLKPVPDLIRMLSERINSFIAAPRSWEPTPPKTEEAWQAAVAPVAREFFSRLHDLTKSRLQLDHLKEWGDAYAEAGGGSARRRARVIRGVYEAAAAVPAEIPTVEATEFLDAIRATFRSAAEAAGAKVV